MTLVNYLVFVLLLLPLLLVGIDASLRLTYISIVSISRHLITPNRIYDELKKPKFLFLIPARNEGEVIASTIQNLVKTIPPTMIGTICIIADNCLDNTKSVSSLSGVTVVSRQGGLPGKGPALSWFAENHNNLIVNNDFIVIFDADTIVSPIFFKSISKKLSPENYAWQAFIYPLQSDKFFWSTAASYSELLSQVIDDVARVKLGWSVPLRGTGMIFRSTTFKSFLTDLQTQVEDIEISVRLAKNNIPVVFLEDAIIYDPKSANMTGLARQRGRWLKGQRQITSLMATDIWKLLSSSISSCSLIQSMLFKPKTLVFIIKIFLILITIVSPSKILFHEIVFYIAVISLLIDILYYLIGLRHVDNPKKYLSMILKLPLYILLWLVGWFFSIVPGWGWMRARD